MISLDGEFGAVDSLTNGNPNIGSFFGKQSDIDGLHTVDELTHRLRIDHHGADQPYALIETRANAVIANNARTPKSSEFFTTNPPDRLLNNPYPYTGNGLPASRDGYVLGEWHTSVSQMDAGLDEAGEAITVMRVRNPDGSAKMISVNGQSASEWKLSPVDPGDPAAGFFWEPL